MDFVLLTAGPAFAPVGIWRDIYLVGYSQPYMEDITVVTTPVAAPSGAEWVLNTTVYTNASTGSTHSVQVALYELHGSLVNSTSYSVVFAAGSNVNSLIMNVDGIKAWWPNGYGSPTLYKLHVTLGEQVFAVQVGFRTIKLVQEPVGSQAGLSYYFAVNDVPIFVKVWSQLALACVCDRHDNVHAV
jgi:beta-mannosidase